MLRRKPLPLICLLGSLEIRIERRSGNRLQIDMHAAAGSEEIDHGQADDERKGGHDLEIDQGLDRYPADLLRLPHRGDAVHHRAKDDQPDEHRNQPDEQIAESAHPFR